MKISGPAGVSAVTAAASRHDDAAPADAGTTGTALVTSAPVAPRPAISQVARHDASFIAHLIAIAQHSPQTRVLRRAEPAAAHAVYRSAAARDQVATQPGTCTRQLV